MKNRKIFLDDDLENRITPEDYKRFTTVESLIDYVKELDSIDSISLDNDLGTELEGYDFVKWFVCNPVPVAEFNIHSRNPVASDNMVALLESARNHGIIEVGKITRTFLFDPSKRTF